MSLCSIPTNWLSFFVIESLDSSLSPIWTEWRIDWFESFKFIQTGYLIDLMLSLCLFFIYSDRLTYWFDSLTVSPYFLNLFRQASLLIDPLSVSPYFFYLFRQADLLIWFYHCVSFIYFIYSDRLAYWFDSLSISPFFKFIQSGWLIDWSSLCVSLFLNLFRQADWLIASLCVFLSPIQMGWLIDWFSLCLLYF